MITIDHKERIADSASKFAAQYHEREAVIIQLQTAVLAQYSSVKSHMTHIKQCMAAMAQGLQSDVLYPDTWQSAGKWCRLAYPATHASGCISFITP
ncbi:hypothetical protein HaLaN_17722 [Haematococcus lacustris]|uniref:Uncharacterized protein n=1 Tax=Haematococcus lacustris TaxID=44745 RepID=A0A699ZD18_HAELA|nr:hypothetical protein HaLaN_17722 [Haematococcus lacustris]